MTKNERLIHKALLESLQKRESEIIELKGELSSVRIKLVKEYRDPVTTEMERRTRWAKHQLTLDHEQCRRGFFNLDMERSEESLEDLWQGEDQEEVINVYQGL